MYQKAKYFTDKIGAYKKQALNQGSPYEEALHFCKLALGYSSRRQNQSVLVKHLTRTIQELTERIAKVKQPNHLLLSQ